MHTDGMASAHNEGATDLPQAMHSIHIMSAEMGGSGGPVHNYIIFRDHSGEDKVMMSGLAIERNESDVRALRGVMAPPNEGGLPQGHFTIVKESEVWCGPVKEYLRKMAMAVEALHFINAQNLNYRPEDQNGDSPNSIAHTLVKAMGLEFPEETSAFWAPGHERIILPKNWRSNYATT
ncbi:MAG: hypothetical protein H6860_06475 [Rhodospirillales bacterium]|nr:hypothetical protein [Alphaproteobacteria bacterium]MCB9982025.1 hypothetical protein [Rhodospirillales bacterium]